MRLVLAGLVALVLAGLAVLVALGLAQVVGQSHHDLHHHHLGLHHQHSTVSPRLSLDTRLLAQEQAQAQ